MAVSHPKGLNAYLQAAFFFRNVADDRNLNIGLLKEPASDVSSTNSKRSIITLLKNFKKFCSVFDLNAVR